MKFINAAIPSSSGTQITEWNPEFGRKVVRMIITEKCPAKTSSAIRWGLKDVGSLTNLDWDFVDKGKSSITMICFGSRGFSVN